MKLKILLTINKLVDISIMINGLNMLIKLAKFQKESLTLKEKKIKNFISNSESKNSDIYLYFSLLCHKI